MIAINANTVADECRIFIVTDLLNIISRTAKIAIDIFQCSLFRLCWPLASNYNLGVLLRVLAKFFVLCDLFHMTLIPKTD